MKNFKTYLILLLSIIIFNFYIYGCISKMNKHKTFINMMLHYYPDYKVEIIESTPNSLIINIIKGE